MQSFDSILQVKNGKNNNNALSIVISEWKSSESSLIMNAAECNVEDESEAWIVIQEEVNEQIKKYIAALAKQLEDLTRLIPGMSTAQQPNNYPKAGASSCFSAAVTSLTDFEGNSVVFTVTSLRQTKLQSSNKTMAVERNRKGPWWVAYHEIVDNFQASQFPATTNISCSLGSW